MFSYFDDKALTDLLHLQQSFLIIHERSPWSLTEPKPFFAILSVVNFMRSVREAKERVWKIHLRLKP